jgi:hypothetical protein
MALIYLDTSHLSLLTRTYTNDPNRFRQFVAAWHSRGHVLAFSLFHLIEFRQHGDKQVRNSRYAVLNELLPFQLSISPHADVIAHDAADREILRALLLKGMMSVKGPASEEWVRSNLRMFPHTIDSRKKLDEMAAFTESWRFRLWVAGMRMAIGTGTNAQHRPPDEKYHSPKLTDLPEAMKLGPVVVATLKLFSWFIGLISIILPAGGRTEIQKLRKFVERSRTVGARSAYAEYAETKIAKYERRRLDRISERKLQKDRVRNLAKAVLHVSDETIIQKLVDTVRLEDCPGTWLKHEVDLEIRKAEPEPDSSNTIDLEHIRYLPYVALLTTDTRIAGYVRNVFQRGKLPQGLQPDHLPQELPQSIAALEALIDRDFTPPAPGCGRGSGG